MYSFFLSCVFNSNLIWIWICICSRSMLFQWENISFLCRKIRANLFSFVPYFCVCSIFEQNIQFSSYWLAFSSYSIENKRYAIRWRWKWRRRKNETKWNTSNEEEMLYLHVKTDFSDNLSLRFFRIMLLFYSAF